jgi:hypothetical protein
MLVTLAILALGFAGCSSKAAAPARKQPELGPLRVAPSKLSALVTKPPRESAFSQYSNPDFGVAFRYPRNFALDETETPENTGVRNQEELQDEEPGAVLIASVVIPDDAYPNTTFAGGSLQFVVNRYLTAGTCRKNLIERVGDSNGRTGATTIQNVDFAWADNDEGDGNTEFFERDYAGFTNGTCYEFFLRAGASANSDGTRPPDDKKILGILEKILASLQFEAKPVSNLDGPPTGRVVQRE